MDIVFQTHCARHRTPLLKTCVACFIDDPLLPIINPPVRNGSLTLPSCWNCGIPFFTYDAERLDSSMVAEIIDLEAAILAAIDGRQPNPRRDGQSCARAFTEKLRILTQHLTTPTDDPLPRFLRIARCRSALVSLPFRTAAAGDAMGSDVLVLALFTDDHPCAPAEFQRIGAVYDLSTVFPRI